jgi:hypothetical protein
LAIAGAVVILAVAVVVAVAVWPRHSHQPPRFTAAPTGSSLSSSANQLVALLNHGAGVTYAATYQATAAALPVVTMRVWQTSQSSREDVIQTTDGQSRTVAAIVSGGAAHLCSQSGSSPWSCQEVAATEANTLGVSGVISAFLGGLGGRGVKESTATIAGLHARCFASSGPDAGAVCASDSGIPLSIADQKVSYRATTVTSSVKAGVFAIPPSES